jgi:hypothetical protein
MPMRERWIPPSAYAKQARLVRRASFGCEEMIASTEHLTAQRRARQVTLGLYLSN